MLGVSTGGRISELLSLQIGDVWQNRKNVHEMLKKAFIAAGLNGKLATHSLRKSFAQRVYEHSGDIYLVQELLGHKSVETTQKYIGINYATARETVETMALGHEPYRMLLLSRSIKKNTDEQLFLELALRGYDLPKLQDNKPKRRRSSILPFNGQIEVNGS